MMRAAARSASSAGVAAALTMGLAGCGDSDKGLALEAARGACTATLQALYDPISIDQAVTIPRVANTSTDAEKLHGRGEIRVHLAARSDFGLSWRILPQELGEASAASSVKEVQILQRELAPNGEPSYACLGLLAVRSLHGVWLRRSGSTQVTEIKLTRHPVSF